MIDDFFKGIETLLQSEFKAMMNGSDMVGRNLRGSQIRRPFKADGK